MYTGHGEFTIVGAGIRGMQQSLLLWPLTQYKFPHAVWNRLWMYAFKCMASSYKLYTLIQYWPNQIKEYHDSVCVVLEYFWLHWKFKVHYLVPQSYTLFKTQNHYQVTRGQFRYVLLLCLFFVVNSTKLSHSVYESVFHSVPALYMSHKCMYIPLHKALCLLMLSVTYHAHLCWHNM